MNSIPNITISNVTGHTLRLNALHIIPTYSGLLEGLPDEALNAKELDHCRDQIQRLYGPGRPVQVLPPAVLMKRGRPHLPPVTCWAWLSSAQPVRDAHRNGSHLFLIWFTGLDPSQSLRNLIVAAAQGLVWTLVAEDFSI
jgi:hypothetical protein